MLDPIKQPKVRNWVFNEIDSEVGFGIKGGFGNRGHHLVSEKSYAETWTPYLINPKGLKLFSASEMDQSWQDPIFNINRELGFYWAALGAMYSGLSSQNVSKSAMQYAYNNKGVRDIFNMYNKYAQQVFPKTATTVVSVFHEGLDVANTVKFLESIYGNAGKKNVQRHIDICKAYESRGARMDDTDVVKVQQVEQRRQQTGYNDAGWDIIEGNYEPFLTQINPEDTSIGLWRVRGKIDASSSKYDRFARSFQNTEDRKKDTMYFKFHKDLFIETLPKSLKFTVTWLDKISGSKWALEYKNSAGTKTQLEITSVGDLTRKSQQFIISDMLIGGQGVNGSDFRLVNTDNLNDIFNGIEVDIDRQPKNLSVDSIESSKIKVYPNPTNGIVFWSKGLKVNEIKVLDMTGALVYEKENIRGNSIDLSYLKKGTYLFCLYTKKEKLAEHIIKL